MTNTHAAETRIGAVQVLRPRIYATPGGDDVLVEPGAYPLVRDADSRIYWVMRGQSSTRIRPRWDDLGHGMFAVRAGWDEPADEDLVVTSKAFTPAEFCEFLASDPTCQEGAPGQRLRVYFAAGGGV